MLKKSAKKKKNTKMLSRKSFLSKQHFSKNSASVVWQKNQTQNLKINLRIKNQFERKNPINWQADKYPAFKLFLKIVPLIPHIPNHSMSYGYFFIRYEHKILRNIYSNKEIADSPQIFTLEKYYETYKKFVKICVGFLSLTSKVHTQGDFFNATVTNFLNEKHPDITIHEFRSKIDKIPKFNQKIYAFVYDSLTDFPTSSDIRFCIKSIN